MISIFDNNPRSDMTLKFFKKVHLLCSGIFSYIEKNEKNLALITGVLILVLAFGGSIKSVVVIFRQFGFNEFETTYKFVESHLVVFESSFLVLKLITVFFVLTFLGKYVLARFVDSTKKMLINIDKNYEKIKESVNNRDLDKYHREIDSNSWASDLDVITELGKEAFGEENVTKKERREMVEEWYKGNPEVFSLILNNKQKPIGYVCILPLKTTIGSHNFSGDFSQFKIPQEAISKDTPTKFICWQAVYLKEDYQDNIVFISTLTRLMFLKTKKFIKETESVIYAESFTDNGTKILRRFGFETTNSISPQKHPIFAIRLADQETLNANAKHSLELIKSVNF